MKGDDLIEINLRSVEAVLLADGWHKCCFVPVVTPEWSSFRVGPLEISKEFDGEVVYKNKRLWAEWLELIDGNDECTSVFCPLSSVIALREQELV